MNLKDIYCIFSREHGINLGDTRENAPYHVRYSDLSALNPPLPKPAELLCIDKPSESYITCTNYGGALELLFELKGHCIADYLMQLDPDADFLSLEIVDAFGDHPKSRDFDKDRRYLESFSGVVFEELLLVLGKIYPVSVSV